MSRNIIDENVVRTNFETDEPSRQKAQQVVDNFFNRLTAKARESTKQSTQADKASVASVVQANKDKLKSIENFNEKSKQLTQTATPFRINTKAFDDTLANMRRLAFKVVALSTTLAYGFNKYLAAQKDLHFTNLRTQIPVERMQEYAYVVSMLGGNAQTAITSLNKFKQTLQDIALGKNTEALEVFGRLGLTAYDSTGNIKTVTSAFGELERAIKKLPSVEQQSHYLKKLGFDEKEFLYFIQNTQKLKDEFQQLYSVVAGAGNTDTYLKDVASTSAEAFAELNKIKTVFSVMVQNIIYTASTKLIPFFQKLRGVFGVNADATRKTLKAISDIFVSFIETMSNAVVRILMFTNSIREWYDTLSMTEKNLLKVGVAVATFFKVFGAQMLTTPFGRLISGLSILLLLMEDYYFYTKQMANTDPNVQYNYAIDWGGVEDKISSVKDTISSVTDVLKDKLAPLANFFSVDLEKITDWLGDLDSADVALAGMAVSAALIVSSLTGLIPIIGSVIKAITTLSVAMMKNPLTAALVVATVAGYEAKQGYDEYKKKNLITEQNPVTGKYEATPYDPEKHGDQPPERSFLGYVDDTLARWVENYIGMPVQKLLDMQNNLVAQGAVAPDGTLTTPQDVRSMPVYNIHNNVTRGATNITVNGNDGRTIATTISDTLNRAEKDDMYNIFGNAESLMTPR